MVGLYAFLCQDLNLKTAVPESCRSTPAATGFCRSASGLTVIILIGALVIADRSRVGSVPVHAALPGNVVVGEPASSWRRFSVRSLWPDSEHPRKPVWIIGGGRFRLEYANLGWLAGPRWICWHGSVGMHLLPTG